MGVDVAGGRVWDDGFCDADAIDVAVLCILYLDDWTTASSRVSSYRCFDLNMFLGAE